MSFPIGDVLIAVGGVMIAAGALANRYHSRRFEEHIDTLRRLANENEASAASQEVQEFSEDRWIDVTTHVMLWEPLGIIILITGLGFILL